MQKQTLIGMIIVALLCVTLAGFAAAEGGPGRNNAPGHNRFNGEFINGTNSSFNDSERPVPPNQQERKAQREQIKEQIKEQREQWKENKEIFKERWSEYTHARDDFKSIKQEFQTSRNAWLEAKGKEKARSGSLGGKGNWSNDTISAAKTMLLNAADTMIANFEAWKLRILSDPLIPADKVVDLNESINGYIDEIQNIRDDIEDATTKEELQNLSEQLRTVTKEAKPRAQLLESSVLGLRVGFVSEKAEDITKRLQNLSASFNAKGYNTTELNDLIGSYAGKVDLAQEKEEAARAKILEAQNATNSTALLEEARGLYTEAHTALKEARDVLHDIVETIRELVGAQGAQMAAAITEGQGEGLTT
jgi:chromosome segregation ATPase